MCRRACSSGPSSCGGGQDRQQHGPRPACPPGPAEDHPGHRQDHDQAGPRPGRGDHRQRGIGGAHPRQCGLLDPGEVAAAADQQSRRHQHDHHDQQRRGPAGREPPAGRPCDQQRQGQHYHIEQRRRVCRRVGQRQRGARRGHPACPLTPVPGTDHAPGGQRDQQHRQRVIGGERPQVKHRARDREQRGGEKRRPPPQEPAGSAPQQDGRPQHEHQRQLPRPSQPPGTIGQRTQRRVDHRRPGEIGSERRDRRAVQPVRPLQVPRPQIRGLILERRVSPHQPHRQQRLHCEHHQQRPRAHQPQRTPRTPPP